MGPLFRDANGALADAVAAARLGNAHSESSAPVAAGGEVTLAMREAAAAVAAPARSRTEARGRVVARLVGVRADYTCKQNFRLVAANGASHFPTEATAAADGLTELVFERLSAGCYALHAQRVLGAVQLVGGWGMRSGSQIGSHVCHATVSIWAKHTNPSPSKPRTTSHR